VSYFDVTLYLRPTSVGKSVLPQQTCLVHKALPKQARREPPIQLGLGSLDPYMTLAKHPGEST